MKKQIEKYVRVCSSKSKGYKQEIETSDVVFSILCLPFALLVIIITLPCSFIAKWLNK